MELQQQQISTANTITGYNDHSIKINDITYDYSIFFKPEGTIEHWQAENAKQITFELLLQASGAQQKQRNVFDFLDDASDGTTPQLENGPEILLIGTGTKQFFLPDEILLPFLKSRIGIECMQTQAAARTYNVLISEGRDVAVALIVD